LPYHALQGTTAAQIANHPFNLTPIGTGAYQLEALRGEAGRIQIVDLRVAPVYRQRPEGQTGYTVDRISFALFDTFDGAVQALMSSAVDGYAARDRTERAALVGLPNNFTTYTKIEPTVGMLIFNWSQDDLPAFRDIRVRQALEIGLNRTSIIERHLSNQALLANSPLLEGSWAYAPDLAWPPFNAAQARDLIALWRIVHC